MIRLCLSVIMFFSLNSYANMNFAKDYSLTQVNINELSDKLTQKIFSQEAWPEQIEIDEVKYEIEYSIKDQLKDYIQNELKRYGSDYASVVVINNNTGEILSAVDYTRDTKKFGKNLAFSATNPAASVFKVITAADLIENGKVEEDEEFTYNGKATTLYKYQLQDKKNRWTRKTTLKKAFASSNNVVFAKAAMNHSSYESIAQMARKFGFNKDLLQLLDHGSSKLFTKNTQYGLAELASGFNRHTLISPLHGAIIASVIANEGILKKPSLISKVSDLDHDLLIWKPKVETERVLSVASAKAMQELMESTVTRGTARGSFRRHRKRILNELNIGGKTGTITGGLPSGKRDWFVSYAMPKNNFDKGISLCVMIVNVNKWYIRSPALAKNIIEYYYSRVQKVGKI